MDLNERCERCGLTWGAHLNTPPHTCPAHQGHMDYVEGTAFKPSGVVEEVEYGTSADLGWNSQKERKQVSSDIDELMGILKEKYTRDQLNDLFESTVTDYGSIGDYVDATTRTMNPSGPYFIRPNYDLPLDKLYIKRDILKVITGMKKR